MEAFGGQWRQQQQQQQLDAEDGYDRTWLL